MLSNSGSGIIYDRIQYLPGTEFALKTLYSLIGDLQQNTVLTPLLITH